MLQLLRMLPTILRDWKAKTPMQKWSFLYGIGKAAFDLTFIPIYKENVAYVHPLGYFMMVYIHACGILQAYTLYYYIQTDRPLLAFRSSPMTGICYGVRLCGQLQITKSSFIYLISLLFLFSH